MRFFASTLVLSCILAPAALQAQAPAVGSTLTLEDAVALAKRSNPAFQTTVNSRVTAANQVRTINGQFLPGVSSSLNGTYRQGGQEFSQFGTSLGSPSDILSSGGSVSASMQFSTRMLSDRKAAKSAQNVTEADISNAEQSLRQRVTNQYIAVLVAEANARLADTLLTTTTAQLELAKAKLQVGTGIQLDVETAEYTNGSQRVQVLRTKNQIDIEKIRLFQEMGVPAQMNVQLSPVTSIELPKYTLAELQEMAKRSNPSLESTRARAEQTGYQLTSARRAYLPAFSLSTGLNGNASGATDGGDFQIAQTQAAIPNQITACQRSEEIRLKLNLDNSYAQCATRFTFTDADAAAIRDANSKFPFGFSRQPLSVTFGLSLPIFNGFQREANVQNANIQRRNALNSQRETEVRLNADVNAAWLNLTTQQQAVTLEEQNSRRARTALVLAQEKYKVGSTTLVELVQARGLFQQAEASRINAIYDFQRQLLILETAVGRPLR